MTVDSISSVIIEHKQSTKLEAVISVDNMTSGIKEAWTPERLGASFILYIKLPKLVVW